MALNSIPNFLKLIVEGFLTVINFSFSSELTLSQSLLMIGLFIIFYLCYDSIKNFLKGESSPNYLLVVRPPEKNSDDYLYFEASNSLEINPSLGSSKDLLLKAQLISRNQTKIRVQLFENSYFNYLTGYSWGSLVQFHLQIGKKLFCFQLGQDLKPLSKGVYASEALEGLMFGSKFRDLIFNDDLKKEIYQEIKNLNLNFQANQRSREVDAELALDSQKNLQEVLKIFKEEAMEIKIKLRPRVIKRGEHYQFYRTDDRDCEEFFSMVESQFRISDGKKTTRKSALKTPDFNHQLVRSKIPIITLKAREAQEFYFYNWVDPRALNSSIDSRLVKTEPVKFFFREVGKKHGDALGRTLFYPSNY